MNDLMLYEIITGMGYQAWDTHADRTNIKSNHIWKDCIAMRISGIGG